ncbi:Endonuclease/exonuclease/phosphatase [Radiomyces spectabilis]|uniref:Endonuclease/exonuclease/phosphatase n=1 Tax=Radiomyces spectabilis TaxID=64574 RepID=UPI00221E59C1|nr:Endonuclease/exonuclease/phosphatase [Radiomyces spectabilis]KAI8364626.1 Endonuclease/exonuclease/phosphatase [Radiomyces spectabilis]
MTDLTITIWNANGIKKQLINSILDHTPDSTLLFITETWLLTPQSFPTNWRQFHIYGQAHPRTYVGSMGISLLINPSSPFKDSIEFMPHDPSSPYYNYVLSCRLGTILIHCLYLPPSIDDPFALEILQSLTTESDTTTTTIFCGDFNARLGPLLGDHRTTSRGTLFNNEWLIPHGLTLWNTTLAFGQPTYYRLDGTSIIDWFISTTPLLNPSMQIRDDLSLGSDHKLVHLTFQYANQPSPPPSGHPRILWRLGKLSNDSEKIRQHYRYLGEQEQLFWNLDAEFNESTNPKPSWTPRVVRHKVRKHHNHLRTDYQEKKKDAAGWKLMQKLKSRRNNKFHERHAAFYVAGAELSTYFAGAEMLLAPGLMSDEEDIIQDNCVIARQVLRPTWRSDKSNAFLDELSALAQKSKTSKRLGRAPLPKEYVDAEVSPKPAL